MHVFKKIKNVEQN